MRRLALLVVATAAAVAASTSLSGVAAAAPAKAAAPPWTTVAAGLNNPRQLTFDAKGNLYVAEAGTGKLHATDQSGGCAAGPEGQSCAGNTASVTRIKNPAGMASSRRVVKGLLSFAGPDGSGATGVDAVSVAPQSGDIWAIETWGPPKAIKLPKSVAKQNGRLIEIDKGGKIDLHFDVASYSLTHQIAGHEPDSDPYGLLRINGTSYVADAAANVVYQIDAWDHLKTVATFNSRPTLRRDAVPTSIAYAGGKFYVGQLGSLIPGAGKITVFNSSWSGLKAYTGLSSVTSVAVAKNGDIYATELFTGAPFASAGALVKIPANGTPWVSTPLPTPGGVAVDAWGHVYVSINSVLPGGGSVIRLNG
jgi:hypothetical protein